MWDFLVLGFFNLWVFLFHGFLILILPNFGVFNHFPEIQNFDTKFKKINRKFKPRAEFPNSKFRPHPGSRIFRSQKFCPNPQIFYAHKKTKFKNRKWNWNELEFLTARVCPDFPPLLNNRNLKIVSITNLENYKIRKRSLTSRPNMFSVKLYDSKSKSPLTA